MKENDQLFELIKSLNRNEKGYFKRFSSHQKGEKNYLRLFDEIEKQSRGSSGEYKEEKILKKFSKEKFIKQFGVTKNQLFNLILKALRNYYAESSIEVELNTLFHNAHILCSKALYKPCIKIIAQAEKLCTVYEKFEHLMLFKELEKRIRVIQGKTVLETIEYQQAVSEKINNRLEYHRLFWIVLSDNRMQVSQNNEALQQYENVILNSLLEDEDKALSSRARQLFHSTHGLYNLRTGNFEKAYGHYKKALAEMELHTEKMQEWVDDYLSVVNNLSVICFRLKKFEEIENFIYKMRMLNGKTSEHLDMKTFMYSYNKEVSLHLSRGDHPKIISSIPAIEDNIKKFNKKIDPQFVLIFYMQFSSVYFEMSSYKEAASWLHKVLNYSESSKPIEEIQSLARIFNIIVHYELGNEELLRYILVSTYRFLYKRKRLYKLEETLLSYIRKNLFNAHTKEEQRKVFKKLYNELSVIFEDPFEKKRMLHFPYLDWLQSKIENRPFLEVVKEKLQ